MISVRTCGHTKVSRLGLHCKHLPISKLAALRRSFRRLYSTLFSMTVSAKPLRRLALAYSTLLVATLLAFACTRHSPFACANLAPYRTMLSPPCQSPHLAKTLVSRMLSNSAISFLNLIHPLLLQISRRSSSHNSRFLTPLRLLPELRALFLPLAHHVPLRSLLLHLLHLLPLHLALGPQHHLHPLPLPLQLQSVLSLPLPPQLQSLLSLPHLPPLPLPVPTHRFLRLDPPLLLSSGPVLRMLP